MKLGAVKKVFGLRNEVVHRLLTLHFFCLVYKMEWICLIYGMISHHYGCKWGG
jgi:hypothetical protein